MNRRHALSISLAVGIAAIAGTVAATKTVQLGHPAAARPTTTSAAIVQRTKALDRTEAALRKALSQRPPKLPPLPKTAATAASGAPISAPAQPSAGQRVVYVRPAPIVRHVHRAGSGEGEHEAEGGSQHEGGGGFDD